MNEPHEVIPQDTLVSPYENNSESQELGYTLEQQIAPETQLQLSMADRASIAPAEVLYRTRRDDAHHRVYVHRSEEAILCVGETQIGESTISYAFNRGYVHTTSSIGKI
ncbi:unnamed protein product [Camellia sinensis]